MNCKIRQFFIVEYPFCVGPFIIGKFFRNTSRVSLLLAFLLMVIHDFLEFSLLLFITVSVILLHILINYQTSHLSAGFIGVLTEQLKTFAKCCIFLKVPNTLNCPGAWKWDEIRIFKVSINKKVNK